MTSKCAPPTMAGLVRNRAPRRAQDVEADSRCAQFSIDHLGIRRAIDADARERTADCWR